MAGFLRRPEPKREIMRADSVQPWKGPACDICFSCFGTSQCQRGNFGRLHIVEEFQLNGSHIVHVISPHYVFARLESMQVMATFDDSMWADPFQDAVKILAHLGFDFQDGEVTDGSDS